ncbi:reticulon-like protein B9 [Phragmites australis]|uniref:reticulon-like protein B9 n=1 Tax=Phragmites australis TaxID=29695 RepID=UPI002D78D2DF|nr:reticulon-like protein B9 [Phragmites australis]
MRPHFASDHGDGRVGGPFHRHRSIHKLPGGGKVEDILLWKDRNLSAGVLAGASLMWYMFDVAEYNIIPLLCQVVIFAMLVIFIWSNAALLLNIAPPRIPEVIISEHAFRETARTIHYKLAYIVAHLYDIACGKDLKKFLLVVGSLLILSEIGSSYSFTTLLYLGFLCAHTLPALYQRYETEVDHLAAKGSEDIKKFYKKIDSNLLNKIPKGPVKSKVK